MSFHPNTPIDVYACFGGERGKKFPHWMLMLRSRGSPFGTWIHSVGGPSQNRSYEVSIQGHKRVDSRGIRSTECLGTITSQEVRRVTAAAQRIAPQQCQTYVVSLIAELERITLLPAGNAESLYDRVQMSERARDYAARNPVPHPLSSLSSYASTSSNASFPSSQRAAGYASQGNGSGFFTTAPRPTTLGQTHHNALTFNNYDGVPAGTSMEYAEPRQTTHGGMYTTSNASSTTSGPPRHPRRRVAQEPSSASCAVM